MHHAYPGPMAPPVWNAVNERKNEHLQLAADLRVQRPGRSNGLERLRFEHLALPELDLDRIDMGLELLGKRLRAPLLIGAMTGGTNQALEINQILAQAAEHCQVGFCLGSQRAMLSLDPKEVETFQVRSWAPTTLILGNIGGIQLRDHLGSQDLEHLGDAVGADGMYIHLNPLQEAIQPEGDRDWRGVLDAIGEVAGACNLPILVKEVGAGLGDRTLQALALTGIAGVETAGVGGTSWARIESLRHDRRTPRQIAGEVLAGFGTCTAESIPLARRALPNRIVIGSGGLRNGLEVATCLALGATACAVAQPLLQAASQGVEAVITEIEGIIETLRITMFLVGAQDLRQLSRTPLQEDWPVLVTQSAQGRERI